MKLLVVSLSVFLASNLALAAKKRVQNSSDSNSSYSTSNESTSKTSVQQRRSNPNAVVRDVTAQIGLNISDQTINSSSSKTGLLVGAAIDLFKFENLTFETGLQYKQMGTSFSGQQGSILHLNYLVIPMAAKYYFMGERQNGVYGKAGLTPAINVSHTISDSSGNNSQDFSNANSFTVGLLLGVGGKLVLSPDLALILEADLDRGLTSALDSSTVGVGVYNTAFTFLSGVSFNL